MQIRTRLAYAMPLAVAVASVALEGNPLDSKEAWIQIAIETGAIACVIICSLLAAGLVEKESSEDNKIQNICMTLAAITASGAYVWAILSQGSTKDMRQIFMDKALHKEAAKAFVKIWVAAIAGASLLPE